MQWITDGLIIRENNVGEYDRAVTVLTRDHGVLHAFSVGARRIKSKKNASTSLLAYSRFKISYSKNAYRIDDASPIEMFFSLRADIVKMSLAQYICDLMNTFAPVEESAEEYLRLALNTLHFLSVNDNDHHRLKAIAELRLLTLSGYQPDLVACRECGSFEQDAMIFDYSAGTIACADCARGDLSAAKAIDRSLLAALRHITYAPLERLFSFSVPAEKAKYLSELTEMYLKHCSERGFKTLDFFHTVE